MLLGEADDLLADLALVKGLRAALDDLRKGAGEVRLREDRAGRRRFAAGRYCARRSATSVFSSEALKKCSLLIVRGKPPSAYSIAGGTRWRDPSCRTVRARRASRRARRARVARGCPSACRPRCEPAQFRCPGAAPVVVEHDARVTLRVVDEHVANAPPRRTCTARPRSARQQWRPQHLSRCHPASAFAAPRARRVSAPKRLPRAVPSPLVGAPTPCSSMPCALPFRMDETD